MIGHGCNEETFEFKYFSILPRRIEAELNFFVSLLQNGSKEPMTCQSLTRTSSLEQPSQPSGQP